MFLRFRTRRFVALLATIAVLFGTFAPGYSQLAHAGQQSGLALVCAGGSFAWVNVATGEIQDAGDQSEQGALDHCPFCIKQSPALTPAQHGDPSYAAAVQAPPAPIIEQARRPLVTWAPTFSRPPPAFA
jgi:hypothetical protein